MLYYIELYYDINIYCYVNVIINMFILKIVIMANIIFKQLDIAIVVDS